MGQVRHGCATTTHAVRAAIQRSQASLAQLSRELGINPKTVAKWRKRATVEDLKTGPKEPGSTDLNVVEEVARHFPKAHAVAVGRYSLRASALDPASDTIGLSPLPTTAIASYVCQMSAETILCARGSSDT